MLLPQLPNGASQATTARAPTTAIVQRDLPPLPMTMTMTITNQLATIPGDPQTPATPQATPQDALTDPAYLLPPNLTILIVISLTRRFSSLTTLLSHRTLTIQRSHRTQLSHRTLTTQRSHRTMYSSILSRRQQNPQSPTARVTFQLNTTHGLLLMPQSKSQTITINQLTHSLMLILGHHSQLNTAPLTTMVVMPIMIQLPSRTTNCTRKLKN